MSLGHCNLDCDISISDNGNCHANIHCGDFIESILRLNYNSTEMRR